MSEPGVFEHERQALAILRRLAEEPGRIGWLARSVMADIVRWGMA